MMRPGSREEAAARRNVGVGPFSVERRDDNNVGNHHMVVDANGNDFAAVFNDDCIGGDFTAAKARATRIAEALNRVPLLSKAETAELVDRINSNPNLQPLSLEEAIHRARYLHGEPGPMDATDTMYAGRIAEGVRRWLATQPAVPIPMVLHCPKCGTQHIDEPTPEWPNPPHRSHLCSNPDCGTIWRPADVPTVGVARVATHSTCDNWTPPPMRDEGDLLAAGGYARRKTDDKWRVL
jgi:hypothetical protein